MADKILTIDQLLMELAKYKHNELHVHHTWSPNHTNWRNKPDAQYWNNSMRNYHVNTRKFKDIAQHVTLTPDGLFITGRPFGQTPASIQGHNIPHGLPFMVELLGNFDKGKDKFEGAQKSSMLKLAKWFDDRGKYIRFHRENAAKTCPGTGIDKAQFLAEVRGQKTDSSRSDPAPRPQPPKPEPKKTWEHYISGSIVKDLQSELNKQFDRKLKIDGYFGDLTIDGLVTVRQGAKGNLTKIIQQRLIALGYNVGKWGADGIFGKGTYDAVVKFQKAKGLAVDGIVGKETWKTLFKK